GAVVGRVAAIRHLVVRRVGFLEPEQRAAGLAGGVEVGGRKSEMWQAERVRGVRLDRKSTRLNSSHGSISYAVFCLKKKNVTTRLPGPRCLPECSSQPPA